MTVNLVMVKINEHSSAAVYLCAVLEYLCTELLELSGNHADASILPCHLRAAIGGDCEFSALIDQLGTDTCQLQSFMFRSLTEPAMEQHASDSDADDDQSGGSGDRSDDNDKVDDEVAASESDECDPDPLDNVGDRLSCGDYNTTWLDEMRQRFAHNRSPAFNMSNMSEWAARVRKILSHVHRGLRIANECADAIETFFQRVCNKILNCAVQLAVLSGASTVSCVDIHNATRLCVTGQLAAQALNQAKRAFTQYVRNCPFRAGTDSRSSMAGLALSVEWCSRALRERCSEAAVAAAASTAALSESHSPLLVRILAHDPLHGYCGHAIAFHFTDGQTISDLLLHVRQDFARFGLMPPARLRCAVIFHVHGEREEAACTESTALVALAKQQRRRQEELVIHCDY